MNGLTWKEYELILAIRGDHSVPKMSFLEGSLELMSPSKSHEQIKKLLARLVEMYAFEKNLVLEGYGSLTMKNAPRQRGVEPDECYAIGAAKEHPDLAIEVNWSSGGLDKLEIYRALQVREVWMWEEGVISVFLFEHDAYRQVERSAILPDLDLALLAGFVGQTQTEAIREFVQYLRR